MLRRIQNLNPSRLFNSSTLNLQKLYVGNMPWGMNDESLRNLFAKHGEVSDAFIVRDRLTGKSRGFGFVGMDSEAESNAAAEALNGFSIEGRQLRVNVAEERAARPKTF